MTDIFREVEEDLRHDRYAKLWAKYGKYVIAAAVALVVATAGAVAWRDYQRKERAAESERYAAGMMMIAENKLPEAADAFAALAKDAGGDYGALARLEEAGLRAQAGDAAGAQRAYDELAADSSAKRSLRDLAVLLSVMHDLDKIDPAEGRARLKPLLAEDNPWRFSARELTALLALRVGDNAGAREAYKAVADDQNAPPALRARATEMLASLGP
ncbi:MAG: tetratricopeptide repeat protein [Alphaproteobacteria bacterium]